VTPPPRSQPWIHTWPTSKRRTPPALLPQSWVAQDGLTKYKAYIDSIAAILKKYPEVSVSLVIGKSRHHDHHHHPLPLIKLINYPLRT
jgi:hypothetical protein